MHLELSNVDQPPFGGVGWSKLLAMSPNPNAPTYGEAIRSALTPEEATRFENYLRPMVDQGVEGRTLDLAVELIEATPASSEVLVCS